MPWWGTVGWVVFAVILIAVISDGAMGGAPKIGTVFVAAGALGAGVAGLIVRGR